MDPFTRETVAGSGQPLQLPPLTWQMGPGQLDTSSEKGLDTPTGSEQLKPPTERARRKSTIIGHLDSVSCRWIVTDRPTD